MSTDYEYRFIYSEIVSGRGTENDVNQIDCCGDHIDHINIQGFEIKKGLSIYFCGVIS